MYVSDGERTYDSGRQSAHALKPKQRLKQEGGEQKIKQQRIRRQSEPGQSTTWRGGG
jgi:hypothetical protein